ncbi:MAG: DUF2147 domain-containing protein [Hyphomonadaceae bacterium]
MRALCLAVCLLSSSAFAQADTGAHDVYGVFETPEGTSHIEISDCGDGTPCGRIVWIDPTSLPEGRTPETVTGHSGQLLMGLQMIEGFERRKRDWRGGSIYDPEGDKKYAARLKRLSDGQLQLKGCIGPICQTQIWAAVAN